MHISIPVRFALAGALVLLSSPATAQIYESVGTRAQGMGGAFVAVADDATATWWNPAGLATGPILGMVLEQVKLEAPPQPVAADPAWRSRSRAFSAVFPSLGLSHYRLRVSEIAPVPATADGLPDRQDQEALGPARLRSLVANQYGVTVGQSLGSHLVIGSTLKLVRGGLVASEATAEGSLEQAEAMDVRLHTRTDLDLGAMASIGVVRLGIGIKNVREPEFGNGANRLKLRRQARTGGAVLAQGASHALTVAFDADLTRTSTAVGEVRHIAAGVEAWLLDRRLGVRGGLGANTVGDGGRTRSGGLSIRVGSGLYVEGAVTAGSERGRDGWAAGLAMTY